MVSPDFGMNVKEKNQPTITFGEGQIMSTTILLAPPGFSDLSTALRPNQPIAIGVQKNDWRARGAWRRTPEFCSAFYVAITGHTRVSV